MIIFESKYMFVCVCLCSLTFVCVLLRPCAFMNVRLCSVPKLTNEHKRTRTSSFP
ncbi:hypothetical protein Hanom_Chr00s000020g01616851 [Helianthus anomalus]